MRIVEYSSEWYPTLYKMAVQISPYTSYRHQPFVDYYYTTGRWSKLFLAVDETGAVVAVQGGELMRFEYDCREVVLSYNRDFVSSKPGAGTYLFRKWMTLSGSKGIGLGGTPDFLKLAQAMKWNCFDGVRLYYMNQPYPRTKGDFPWKTAAKWALDQFRRKRISSFSTRLPAGVLRRLSVREEHACSSDMLPKRSPFAFRFAPTLDHLNWRYRTGLSFVRYRVFRILVNGATAGYVILNETPRRLMLAHCDGEDPEILAWGAILSFLEAGREDTDPRTMMLCSSHVGMARIFEQFGFKGHDSDRVNPLVLGGLRPGVDVPSDTSNWLVNYDWGGRALRSWFLDQEIPAGQRVRD